MAKKNDKAECVRHRNHAPLQDFSRWYLDVVRRAELADYSPVKGCMVIRPYGYAIWELMQQAFDREFKRTGHVNAYFPLFIPESLLTQGGRARRRVRAAGRLRHARRRRRAGGEARRPPDLRSDHRHHVREVGAVVARPADPDQPVGQRRALGEGDAAVPAHDRVSLAGRAHRARNRRRGRGRDADDSRLVQAAVRNRCSAMPVVKGQKSESEKFAGALRTYSIEALMGDGRALQAGHLAQSRTELRQGVRHHLPGARQVGPARLGHVLGRVDAARSARVIMTHGDDSGLVLPPRIAPYQVVIVPIGRDNWRETVLPRAREIQRRARRRPAFASRSTTATSVRAGSSPSGSCAACRSGSKSVPRTSRNRRC